MKLAELKSILYRYSAKARPGGAVSTYRWDGYLNHVVTVFEASDAMPNIRSSLELECGADDAQVCKVWFTDADEEEQIEKWLTQEVGGSLVIADLVGVNAYRWEQVQERINKALILHDVEIDTPSDWDASDWIAHTEELIAILRAE